MLTGPDGSPALGLGRVEDHQPPVVARRGRAQAVPPRPRGRRRRRDDRARDRRSARRCADPQPGETWRVLIDPAGHPFCLTDAANWG